MLWINKISISVKNKNKLIKYLVLLDIYNLEYKLKLNKNNAVIKI